MPVKSKKTKSRKSPSAAVKAAKKSKKTSLKMLASQDVPAHEVQAASETPSERAWLSMTMPQGEDDEGWNKVEEKLRAKADDRDSAWRRWKYFSK